MTYKITIIIPTYNRPDYVLRQIRILSGFPVLVHFLDGSEVALNTDQLGNLPENIIYHHLPISMDARIKYSIDLVQTPYAAFLSDDDIFVPAGIFACIDYLDKHHDYVSCIGRTLGFTFENGSLKARLMYPHMQLRRLRNLNDEDFAKRLKKHFNPYSPSSYYSVMRTDAWKTSVRAASKSFYSCVYSGELMFEATTTIQGKSRVLPELLWLRSFENGPVSNPNWNRKYSFHEWFLDKKYSEEVSLFISNIASEIIRIHGGNVGDATKCAIESMNEYVNYCKLPKNETRFARIHARIINKLGLRENRLRNLKDTLDFMIHDGCKVNFSELENIMNTVKEFHQKN